MKLKAALAIAVAVTASMAFGIGGAGGSDPPGDALTYSSALDMWLPQEKIDEIAAAEAAGVPVPPETPADTEYTTEPEPVDVGIHPVGADWSPAFGPEVLSPTNLWVTQDANRLEAVVAGARGDEPQTGLLVIFKQFYASGDEDSAFKLAPQGTGALTITTVSGNTLSFSSASGQTGTLDLNTEQLQMNP